MTCILLIWKLIRRSELGRGGQCRGYRAVVGIVDEDNVATGAVEQARGDRRAISTGTMHPQLPRRQRVEPVEQVGQRNVRRAGYVANGVCVVAPDIEEHRIAVRDLFRSAVVVE